MALKETNIGKRKKYALQQSARIYAKTTLKSRLTPGY